MGCVVDEPVVEEVVAIIAEGRGRGIDAELDVLRAAVTFEASLRVTIPDALLNAETFGSDESVRALARNLLGG